MSSNISSVLNSYSSNVSSTTSTTKSTNSTDSTATKKPVSYSDTTSVGLYLNSTPSGKADAKSIFSNLSLDVGGDGKTITKDQLNSYVKKAQDGKISIPKEELDALITLQKNWDKISTGGDKISYANVSASGNKSTLLSMVPTANSSKTVDMSEDAAASMTKINNMLISSALGTSTNNSSPKDSYSAMLKTLLSGTTDENDDSNANLIATLTNLIANSKSASTVETEA